MACRLADASLLQAQKSTRKSTSQAPGKAPARAQIATRTSQRQSKNSTQTWLADQKNKSCFANKKHNLENYPSKKSTSKSQNEHQPFCPPEHQKEHQTSTKKAQFRKLPEQKKHQEIAKKAPANRNRSTKNSTSFCNKSAIRPGHQF